MKKTLLALVALALCLLTNAQGTLQFSKVNLLTASVPYNNYVAVGTVPAGKVWKLENASLMYNTTALTTNYILLRLNGTTLMQLPCQQSSSSATMNSASFWFPPGTVTEAYDITSTFTPVNLLLNVLEFTVE